MSEFYSKANELLSRGLPFATAVVVRAERPTSAKPGDKAIVTPEGVLYGWIGGSCAQPTVIREALRALEDGEPRFIRLSTNPGENQRQAGVIDLLMTCFSGGTLEIYIEPQLPTPRLMVIGSLPVAQALVRLGKSMHYHVVAVDLDTKGSSLPEADEVLTDLKEIPARVTPLTYIVVASHGNYDEAALELALAGPAEYVALVSSKKRAATVLEYLKAQGLPQAALNRLKYPAGLDIQALQGEEIALSILAEIVQTRRSRAAKPAAQAPAKPKRVFNLTPAATQKALDPVCGMTVEIATAHYMSEFEGRLYYFCAAGCKLAFEKAPQTYLHSSDAR